MYKKILLATDGSEHSAKAAKRVVELQKKFDSEVVFFYAENHHYISQEITLYMPKPWFDFGSYTIPPADYALIKEQYKKLAEHVISLTKAVFDEAKVPAEGRIIYDIDPGSYARDIVRSEHFDLVVVACHGHHSKLRSTFVGTVAQKIMNESDCDVLIVR